MDEAPDPQFIELVRTGDERAADELARHACSVARRVLRRWFWSTEDVEDCAQDVVLRVMTHLHQLRDGTRFEGWVATIARHSAFSLQRDNRTLPLPVDSANRDLPLASPGPDPPLQVELEQARARLSPRRRALLDMRYHDQLSYAEIADHLQTTVPVVRRRLQGARDQLRREVLRYMVSEHGEAVKLDRTDLDRLYAAASLVDPEGEGSLCAVHVAGKGVFGGTTHRAAVGALNCQEELPALALSPIPFLQLRDHADVKAGFIGWDDGNARLSLDDGTVLAAERLDQASPDPAAWTMPDWPLPHAADASRAEMLELAEHIAGAGWGGREAARAGAVCCLSMLPGVIAATVFRRAPVTFMLSGQLGCRSETTATTQILLNRAYVRDCLAALPAGAERVRIEFGSPAEALRFSTPSCPGLAVLMMPRHPDHLTSEERQAWAECLDRQSTTRPRL